jgi:hypothetical protein
MANPAQLDPVRAAAQRYCDLDDKVVDPERDEEHISVVSIAMEFRTTVGYSIPCRLQDRMRSIYVKMIWPPAARS